MVRDTGGGMRARSVFDRIYSLPYTCVHVSNTKIEMEGDRMRLAGLRGSSETPNLDRPDH